ncbi:GGDEF domain-containing protein [Marinobacterium sediminicola]|uniref:diguanylate cyclase n=1 Tax=Marinobacterium sediminicola TaxID=518898 RepID=A0ABY1S318_9GAMM|nr:diguanylate cyclase [Marinobacterium sediminicola]ULG69313.1 diguanylate cyclase [Marinobacterium sediminicola]SMR77664.1 Diguanylate cyclase, GGDEF domain [Marinobacterium sediminicola]
MSDQTNWKRKYTDLTLEVDQQRQADAHWRDQLIVLTRHLSLGLKGNEATLDEALDALDGVLVSQDTARMLPVNRNIKQQLSQFDLDRQRARESLQRSLKRWGQQLRKINGVPALEPAISDVETRSQTAVEQLGSLARLMTELVELQANILGSSESGRSATDEFELNQDGHQNLELLQAEIAHRLIRLLELLQVPAEGVEKARRLVQELESGLKLERLPEVISTLTELVRMAGGNSQEDFENYLLTLNSQLAYVQQFLEESRCDEQEARKAHQDLDDVVRRDVRNIHRTVKDASDLGQLKQSVTRQLASIMRSMEQFRLHEQEREDRLNQRYNELLNKVDQMELETSKARARMQEEQLRARTDPLTGLPNRTAYEQHLQTEMQRWDRYRACFSMAVGDIDYFKRINDQLGHLAGDRVLRLVAKVLRQNLRGTDFIARFGGEEFVILFPSTRAEEALQATEKLRLAVQNSPFNFKGKPVEVTLSFGVAEVEDGDDLESLFTRADKALYRAKEQGRNQTQPALAG